ncbi:multiple inositol polyphosphate phosphatase 1-like isoform X1 [Limulus polyphemus]|uniref:Multiple inositol polyphosphate phosphatase 1 n=1 Tax=Limulus polyphemus TaxID=6850 RepID=A0ABM1BMI8_LIMPO|nr:multiple inositol polyphosphate phosphatase 1-like isoform X1 [Limulus polyphemus]
MQEKSSKRHNNIASIDKRNFRGEDGNKIKNQSNSLKWNMNKIFRPWPVHKKDQTDSESGNGFWPFTGFYIYIAYIFAVCAVILGLLLNKQGEGAPDSCFQFNRLDSCYFNDTKPYRLYGSKTTYSVARGSSSIKPLENNDSECEPVFLYLLNRHATRYPDAEDIVEMGERLVILQGLLSNAIEHGQVHMCPSDISEILSWKINMIPSDDNSVSDSGKEEAEDLARRLKMAFPTLLSRNYTSSDFEFGFTSRVRTRTTAEAFAKGLFGEAALEIEYPEPKDDRLQFHKLCNKIIKESGVIDKEYEELTKFDDGYLMESVRKSVSWRLGFNATRKDVKLMRNTCRFEFALFGASPWCAVFNTEEIKVLEFWDDLDDYYEDIYGSERNYLQACPIIKDFIDYFNLAVKGKGPKAVLHFSHAGALKKVFTRLGLFLNSPPLMADNYCESESRKYRSSLVCPFNANLLLVLYKCHDEYFVSSFLQEKPVVLEGCEDSVCPLNTFNSVYAPMASNCNLYEICSLPYA